MKEEQLINSWANLVVEGNCDGCDIPEDKMTEEEEGNTTLPKMSYNSPFTAFFQCVDGIVRESNYQRYLDGRSEDIVDRKIGRFNKDRAASMSTPIDQKYEKSVKRENQLREDRKANGAKCQEQFNKTVSEAGLDFKVDLQKVNVAALLTIVQDSEFYRIYDEEHLKCIIIRQDGFIPDQLKVVAENKDVSSKLFKDFLGSFKSSDLRKKKF